MVVRKPASTRWIVGITLLVFGMATGAFFQLVILGLPHLVLSKHAGVEWTAMGIGALLAIPLLLVYVWVPWLVDRYDPEPLWALLLCLAWGAVGAGGWSLMINSVVHAVFGGVVSACLCAPFVEELTKASAVFFMFYFMRREFDGVVDGVVYGTFAALGFACFENILYYSRAVTEEMLTTKENLLLGQVVIRGILKPWGHPLYTAITGLGFGIARETNKRWLRWLAPLGCFSVAVFLHSLWNTSVMLVGALALPLFFLIVIAFFVLVLFLVRRKGKIIRDHLRDEVVMGNLTSWELDLVTSPIARLRATFYFGGAAGRRFVGTASRLALSKWHAGRAMQGRKRTVSGGLILPLRQELHRLRAVVSVTLRRPLPQPRPWYPSAPWVHPQRR
jgi:RsiW-degrading membrane proteinase PrsW (M82 family)